MADTSMKTAFEGTVTQKPSVDKRLLELVMLLEGVAGPHFGFRVEYASVSDFEIKFATRNMHDRVENSLRVKMNDHGEYSLTPEGPMAHPPLQVADGRCVRMAVNDWISTLQQTYKFDCQPDLRRRRIDRADMVRMKPVEF